MASSSKCNATQQQQQPSSNQLLSIMHDRRTFGWISPLSFVRAGASTEEVDFGDGSNVASGQKC